MNFFITGLPRTRTAWLANLFTYGSSYCFHEPASRHGDYLGIRTEIMERQGEYIGVSDCSLPFYYQDLAETLPGQRLLIVERPIEDVMESLDAWMAGTPYDEGKLLNILNVTKEKLEWMKHYYENKTVGFDELENFEVIREVWDYLTPGLAFDEERTRMLSSIRLDKIKETFFNDFSLDNYKSLIGEF
jgi:hypothetical protein